MPDIESLLKEKRVFEPSKEFAKGALWNKREAAALRKPARKPAPTEPQQDKEPKP